jgi:aminoglycoside phosphotransferase (APT) family kinase protein
MPAAEVEINVPLVRSLIRSQRPDLADLEVQPLANGWDNVMFRVGAELVARLPRRALSAKLIENEAHWLPVLAPNLSLAVPTPLFVGEPGDNYPWRWALTRWIRGDPVAESDALALDRAAEELGWFLRGLHTPAPPDFPENPLRGVPLPERDEATRERIHQLRSMIDAPAARRAWDGLVATPCFPGEPVWIHGDLHPGNMLAANRRLTGVIDFGDITAGDPATDLSVAWMLFPADIRRHFRDAYGGVDDDTWARARGWALSLAMAYLAHSADHPTMGRVGSTTLENALGEG